MEKAYSFISTNKMGVSISGVVFAEDKDLSWVKLNKAGLKVQTLDFNLAETINSLTSKEFNLRDLSMFYQNIGKRSLSGRPIVEGLLSASSFITDPRLKQGALLVSQAVMEGKDMHVAMREASFPARDVMAISAAKEHGGIGQAFISLGEDTIREFTFSTKIKAIFTGPMIMTLVIYVAFYLGALFFVPGVKSMFDSLHLPERSIALPQKIMFGLSELIQQSIVISATLWAAPVIALFFAHQKGYTKKAGNWFKLWRTISEKSDMSRTWSAFGLLYEAGISPSEAAKTVAPTASRDDTREMFNRAEKLFFTGHSTSEAVKRAEFPAYIINAIVAADSSGFPLPSEIKAMTKLIDDEVDIYVRKFQDKMEVVSKVLPGLMLLLFFMGTMGGVMMTALKNV